MPLYTCLSEWALWLLSAFEEAAGTAVGHVHCQQEAEDNLIMILSMQIGQLDASKAGGRVLVLEREKQYVRILNWTHHSLVKTYAN